MLPQSYQLPAAALLVFGGVVACFAGYRLFRTVLAIYGFILGAALASSMMGITNTAGMILAAIAGGLVGALILTFAYFIAIALVGAGLGAFVAHVVWGPLAPRMAPASAGALGGLLAGSPAGDPPALLVIVLALLGAIGAMLLQRYVIIAATAFGGAWTIIVGALALAGEGRAGRAAAGNVWILYPLGPSAGYSWIPFAWILLGIVGTGVQLGITGRKT